MYFGSNNSWDKALSLMFGLSLLGIVLGIWKLIDICIWIYNHVGVTIN